MSENKFESVSAVVDGQDTDSQTLEQLKHDDNYANTFGRYQLIGDVLRGDCSQYLAPNLAADIASAIAAEPTVLAPVQRPSVGQRLKAKVIQLARPAGQMAIAASAAGLMVLGVQHANQTDEQPIAPVQVWQPQYSAGVADPVSYNYSTYSVDQQRQQAIQHHKKLQSLLNDHQAQIKLQQREELNNQQPRQTEQPEGVEK
ncbi:sigma-E factor negative regulatory protein [Thalassotalea maritima]|uniref:sigma-E factor negative regulatory protein n=1 Tax=Thalassotalea maritima TaxID=3242416 RepID=UPI003527599D